MKDRAKTKARLIDELGELRQRLAQLEVEEAERRKAEEALRASEARYRAVVESQTELIRRYLPDGTITFANGAYCRYFGKTPEELIGQTLTQTVPEEERESIAKHFALLSPETPIVTYEHRVIRPDGQIRWQRWTDRGIYDVEGNLVEIQGVGHDSTDQRRTERDRGRLFNLSIDMRCVAGFDGFFKQVNPAWTKTLGWTEEELLNKAWIEFVHPEDRKDTASAGEGLIEGRAAYSFENRYLAKDGTYRRLAWNAFPLPEEKLIFAVARDVTESGRTEEELRELNEKLEEQIEIRTQALGESELWMRTIFNSLEEAVIVLTPDRVVREVNPAAERMFGYTNQEVSGQSAKLYHVDDNHYVAFGERISEAFNEGKSAEFEFEFKRKTGEIFPTAHSLSLLRDEAGTPFGILSVVRDLTVLKEAEKELRGSEKKYRELAELLPQLVYEVDDTGFITFMNAAGSQMTGYSAEDISRGLNIRHMLRAEDLESVLQDFSDALRGEPLQGKEYTIIGKDGRNILIIVYSSPVREDHRIVGLRGVGIDIAERKEAEKTIRQQTEFLRTVVESLTHPFCVINPLDYTISLANSAALEASSREVTTCYALFHGRSEPCNTDVGPCAMEQVMKTKEPVTVEHVDYEKDGSTRIMEVHAYPLLDKIGKVSQVIEYALDITDRKRAEEALRESEHMLGTILSTSPVGIALTKKRRVEWANEPWRQMFGFEHEQEYLGRDTRMLYLSDEEYHRMGKSLYQDLETGKVAGADTRFRRKDGSVFDAHVKIKALDPLDPDRGTISAVSDISSRKRAEDALRESEEKYRGLFNNAQVGMFRTRLDGSEFLDMNQEVLKIFGRTREEMQGSPSVIHWVDPHEREEMVRRLNAEGRVTDFECKMRNKQGEVRLCAMSLQLYPEQGLLEGSIIDMTDRKKMEAALRESEQTLRTMVTDHPESFTLIDTKGTILGCSDVTAQRFGRPMDDIVGSCVYDHLPPAIAQRCREYVKEAIRTNRPIRFEDIRGGHTFDHHMQAIGDDQGTVERLAVLSVDITNLRKAEEVQRRLATAIEQSAEIVLITDADGVIQYVNPVTERITGFDRSEIIGNTPNIFKSGEHDKAFYEELWDTIKAGKVWAGRMTNRKKDGTLYHEEATISPIRDASGKIVNFVAVNRDITEHLQLAEQLFRSQKMESLGQMAGGIAHDFNNLLTIIMGYSELLLESKKERDPDYEDLQKIVFTAEKGAELVQRILTFSRKIEPNRRPIDLNREVKQCKNLLARTIPKMIAIDLRLAKGLKRVNADPAQLEQVLLNLAVNAHHAMPKGGTLTFETENVTLDEEYCRTLVECEPGEYVMLNVSDTGHGMEKEVQQRVFEPFYTTKETGGGTGLGLAVVYGIIKGHGGHIFCYSEPGNGTTFRIYFPTAEKETRSVESIGEKASRGGTETVLLVDDEEFVRDLGERILAQAGYKVLTAENGQKALEVYQNRKADISLVILDLVMPQMGGKECLEKLLKIDPKTRVIVASGFSPDGPTEGSSEAGARAFIGKPYKGKELLQMVRKVLDEE